MDPQLFAALAQTGAVGAIAYLLITRLLGPLMNRLSDDVHGLRVEMGERNGSLKVLLDRSIRASEQVASEARRSREDVTGVLSEKLDKIAQVQQEHNTP